MTESKQESVESLFQRGTELHANGDFAAAAALFRQANKLDPRHPEIWGNLGAATMALESYDEAERAFAKALKLNPDFAIVHNNLGNLFRAQGNVYKAEASYRRALKIDPRFAEAAANLGMVLIRKGGFQEAGEVLEEGGRAGPNPGIYKGLGLLFEALREREKAVEYFRKALDLGPSDPEILNNLGASLHGLGRIDEALDVLHQALRQDPNCVEVYQNLGTLFLTEGRYDEAVAIFQQAARIDPNNRAISPYLAMALTYQCSWSNLTGITEQIIANTEYELAQGLPVSADPFGMLSLNTNHKLRAQVTESIAKSIQDRVRLVRQANPFTYAGRGPKLKIGLVSPDFRDHSAGHLFFGLCQAYDRSRFEFHGYMLSVDGEDALTAKFRQQLVGFRNIGSLPLADAARLVNQDGINVLVDLAGHTRGAWADLLAMRPAPVQVSAIGYGAALGGNLVDYLITDDAMWPEKDQQYCSEKLVYLPHASLPGAPREFSGRTFTRSQAGLPDQGVVFANFNGHYKFDPLSFGAWMRILSKVPGSVLWVMEGSETSRANLTKEAQARGIAADRLVFAESVTVADHMSRLRLADVALDGTNLEGGATTLDALWAGVPVVVARGETYSNRGRSKMIEVCGMPELTAGSLDEYQRIAIDLGNNPEKLAATKAKLAANLKSTPLFDLDRFTRYFERSLEMVWQNYESGNPPQHMQVPE